MPRVKRLLRWLALGLGGALGLIALTIGSLYGLAQSEGGRAWLVDRLESILSTPGEFELAIGRLDGPLPQSPRLASVQISDGEGPWLEAAAVRLDWQPFKLLGGTLWIEAFEVDGLRVLRRPATRADRGSEPADFSLPSLPVRTTVKRLALEDVALDAPVLGVPASFRVLGEASTPTTDDFRASLLVERSDGTAGRLQAEGHYRLSDQNLKLALSLDEPAGGLIARALELPDLPAVAARFDGDGPISAWGGHLALELTGLGSAELDMELSGQGGDLAFRLKGATETGRALEQAPWMLLAGRTSLEVAGRWSEPALLAIDQADFESAAARLALSGTLDLESLEANAAAEASLSDGRVLAAFVEGIESDRLALRARLQGTLEQGELSLEASTTRLRAPGAEVRDATARILARRPLGEPEVLAEIELGAARAAPVAADAVTARATFSPDRPLDGGLGAGPLELSGGARRLDVEGEPALQALLGEGDIAWEFAGRLDPLGDRLAAEALKLHSEHLTLTAAGDLDLARGGADATVELDFSNLAGLDPLLGLGLSGRAEASATLRARDFGESLEARISGVLGALAVDDEVVQALLTDRADLSADLALRPGGDLVVGDLSLQTRHARLAGSATLSDQFERLEADYRLAVEDLGVLAGAVGLDLSGAAEAQGKATGSAGNPSVSGRVVMEEPAIEGIALARLDLDYAAEDLADRPRGRVTARAEAPVAEVVGQSEFLLDGRVLHLSELKLQTGESHAGGDAAIALDSGLITGRAEARSPDLGPWLAMAGLSGGGSGTAELTLSAADDRQAGTFGAKVKNLSLRIEDGRSLRAGGVALRFESGDLLGELAGTVALSAEEIATDDLDLDTLSVDAHGALAGADYRVAMAGQWNGPMSLNAEGRLAVSGQQVAVDVARLEGTVLGSALSARRGFRVVQAPGIMELADADLTFGEARIAASGRLGPDTFAGDVAAANLSFAQLAPILPVTGMTGLINGDLELAGTAAKPTGRLTLSLTDLKVDAVSEAPPGELALSGDWRGERLALEGSLKGLAEKDAAFSLDLPLRLDPATFAPTMAKDAALGGRLTWQGDIAELWPLVPIVGHDLAGLCQADLALGGSLASPRLSGSLRLEEGAYENYASGTLLRDLALDLQLEGQRVKLARLEAKDGASGSLSARGELDLDPNRDYPVALSGALKDFTLVRLDDATAAARGELSLNGSLSGALLRGRLETRGVEIRIPDRLPPQVVELEVVEAGKEGDQSPWETAAIDQEQPFRLSLDLDVTMPKRVFLRGRGLDSEWAGQLAVAGTADKPILTGKLELVRGQVSVIGRSFKLGKGQVEFLGGDKIDPLIDVEAVSEQDDLIATVRVSGPATNPEITLSSTPELPQDEIVSRLLFGRGTAELTALEAVQLAAAVAELSGRGGGAGGILDLVRGQLGIDVLRIESAGEGDTTGAAVSAGKYLKDGVYVGVSQATAANTGSVELEVEITPNISIESKMGQSGQSNFGVKFKWDY